MFEEMAPPFAASVGYPLLVGVLVALGLFALLTAAFLLRLGAFWFQAYMSGADVSLVSLIGMTFRQVKPRLIVTAKVMGRQAGLNIDREQGMSTARLEAHFLAGGNVMNVLTAIIAATHSATSRGRSIRTAPKQPDCTRSDGQPTLRLISS